MDYLLRILPPLLDGAGVTLGLFVVTLALSLPLGLALALARLSRLAALRGAVSGFIWLMRGTPLMLQLLFVYYALPFVPVIGVRLPDYPAAVVAFTLNYAAYFAEILRAGIQSLDHGQADAAKALGMRSWQAMRRIILPQALRQMVPPLAGQTIIQMKNTTLLSVLTVPDLLYPASYVSSFTYRPMEVYTVVGLIFLAVLIPSNYLARRLEMRRH